MKVMGARRKVLRVKGISSCFLLFVDTYFTEEYPVLLNVVYCKRVVTTGESRTALWSCSPRARHMAMSVYVRVATACSDAPSA